MLDKRKVSVLSTCQSAISKEIDSYRKDAADIHMLLSHLVYISNTIASVREATSRADPDIILHSFVGLPGALTSRLLHEGQNSAYQLKYFERALDDHVMRMRRLADEAMETLIGEECPTAQAFEGQRVGMYIEIATEAQSVYQAIYQLHSKLKDVLSRHVQQEILPSPSLSLSEAPQPLTGAVMQPHRPREWFDENGLKAALEKWEELTANEDDRVRRWRMLNLINSDSG